MAKSIRSKRKRKMRNVKRQKNAPKELALLKKVLSSGIEPDVEMKDLVTVTTAKKIIEDKEKKEKMELESAAPKYDKKTMRDENGHYPVWMSCRQIKKKKRAKISKPKGGTQQGGNKAKRRMKKGIAW